MQAECLKPPTEACPDEKQNMRRLGAMLSTLRKRKTKLIAAIETGFEDWKTDTQERLEALQEARVISMSQGFSRSRAKS